MRKKNQSFGFHSTAEQVSAGVSMHGKTVIVTGCNSGIGRETIRALAKRGAFIVMACRDAAKARTVEESIKEELPEAQLQVLELDLASLASIRKFVSDFDALNRPLHILINNAGVMACPYAKTVDGFEMQFGTNHLGHFLLTNLLLHRLKEGAPARVINVSSAGHKLKGMRWKDIQFTDKYSAWKAYGQSKTANILFSLELTKRFSADGIYSNALHPGMIGSTDLGRYMKFKALSGQTFLTKSLEKLGIFKTIPEGAATQVYLATAPDFDATGGLYLVDCKPAKPSPHATNPQDAERLWEESAKLVGL